MPVAAVLAVATAGLGAFALVRATLDPRVVPPPPPASAAERDACAALVAALPQTLSGQDRRGTRPTSALTTAYGSPPVTVRCGVAEPGVTADYACLSVDTLDWLVVPGKGSTLYLSFGTRPAVEVEVPDAYAVPPLEGISPAVGRLPENGLRCVAAGDP